MLDAIVQFIRNALCCVKDLNLYPESLIHNATYTEQVLGYKFPDPLYKTSPLEVLISITQLYACLSLSKSGFTLLTSSVGKLKRILRLVQTRITNMPKDFDPAERLVNESLLKQAKYAMKSVVIGFLVYPIGIAFWWLFLNSWHITETDWFGGLQALIHALSVMEICLVPLLYFMIAEGIEKIQKSNSTKDLLDTIQQGKLSAPQSVSIETYESMTEWEPFWDSGVSMFASGTSGSSEGGENDESKLLEEEVKKVRTTLATWFPNSGSKEKEEMKSAAGEKEKLQKEALQKAQEKLEASIPVLRMEGYREFVYFVLNFIAFYGYLMGIIAFYFDDEASQPSYIRSLKFGYGNVDADWHGNFAGDLMWTIEPLVILGSPYLFTWIGKPQKKVKAD